MDIKPVTAGARPLPGFLCRRDLLFSFSILLDFFLDLFFSLFWGGVLKATVAGDLQGVGSIIYARQRSVLTEMRGLGTPVGISIPLRHVPMLPPNLISVYGK